MGLRRWRSVVGSVLGGAGLAAIAIGTVPSILAADPLDEPSASGRVVCASVDPGFSHDLEETLRGLHDPGFFPVGSGSGLPAGGGSVDPGFWQPAGNCPIGPLENVLASPAADILDGGGRATATPVP